MFEKFTRANARDFATRYQGTFGFFHNNAEGKAPWLAKLTFVEDQVVFLNSRSSEFRLNPDLEEDVGFEFLPPKSGFFNTEDGAIYVERVATRQYQRGISDRNTKLYLVTATGFTSAAVNFRNLGAIYENKILKLEAYRKWATGKLPSYALSGQFAVDTKFIYVFSTAIGKVESYDAENIKFKLDDPDMFRTEINDAMKGIAKVEFVQ